MLELAAFAVLASANIDSSAGQKAVSTIAETIEGQKHQESKTPIKHIIVISQGRRSFDNYFGIYPGVNGLQNDTKVPTYPVDPHLDRFTLTLWFRTDVDFGSDSFMMNSGGLGSEKPSQNMNYGIWMNKEEEIVGGFETENGTDYFLNSSAKYNDGIWHFVALRLNGTAVDLFIDGTKDESKSIPLGISPGSNLKPTRVGANSYKPSNFFTGDIGGVQLTKTVLSDRILSEIYHTTRPGISSPQVQDSLFKGWGPIYNFKDVSGNVPYVSFNGSNYRDMRRNDGNYTLPFHLDNPITEGPVYGPTSYRISYNDGLMDGFIYAQGKNGTLTNKSTVMGYYDNRTIPYYWKLASQFVLADSFFSPTMSSGFINQLYLYAGDSKNYGKYVPSSGLININRTIFDQAEDKGIEWKVYIQDYDSELNHTKALRKNLFYNPLLAIPRFINNHTLNSHIVDLTNYYTDLRSDKFPSVAYIIAPDLDESAPKDITKGEQFVTSLILSLVKSKHWNDSAFILTYRESGGWYDHVAPPQIDKKGYGFRVPMLVISPYAKKGYIDSTPYDVTSILKFIEYNFNLSPLSKRDNLSNNMLAAFDFISAPRSPYNISDLSLSSNMEPQPPLFKNEGLEFVNLTYGVVMITISSSILLITLGLRNRR